ncbi:helix-hairpin-helix domain-containing protein [Micromonospora echinofusca]|uniref:ComEA family DNA-binding protein n=1 Tax=Micromonospora echinofusca TaxID=47858 RepID=A0ABS3VSJ5_MICEH|nr:helix-hairpin-helix domain-containing protein [Micromonospora echinofusca]MBO4207333.1 ComEA family DNA-binding protein [Micromonospora echinofusca]
MPDDQESVVRQRLLSLLDRSLRDGPSGAGPQRQALGAGTQEPALGAVAAGPAPSGSVLSGSAAADVVRRSGPAPGGGRTDPTDPPTPRLAGPGPFDPGRRGVKALAAVAGLVVLVAAGWAWQSRPRTEPVGRATPSTPAGLSPPAGSPEGPSAAGSAGTGELVVAVAGKVRRPGLVRLPAGARVADAITAAGGALPGVDVALLNLARKVSDGELILVGVTAPPGAAPAGGSGAVPGAPGGPADGLPAGGKVNLNTATLAQLDTLPGVGPVLAQRILAHRDQHGGFRAVSDLRQVDGIGESRYEQLKDLVTV